jgi:hypothetical protein
MSKLEDEPWYREWHEALHRALGARITLARRVEPPEREAAQKEYNEALAAYHILAPLISSIVHGGRSGTRPTF